MKKRKSLSNKTRFEVFKRDKFTCQYCGGKAPDVVLNVDHIVPVAKGGGNEILNLVTSCFDCNSGKKDRELLDTSVMDLQRSQLECIQERRNQLAMFRKWREECAKEKDEELDLIDFEIWMRFGAHLNENGRAEFRKHIDRFGVHPLIAAIEIAHNGYEGEIEVSLSRVAGIAFNRELEVKSPTLARASYIFGILRRRFKQADKSYYWPVVKESIRLNVDIETVADFAKSVDSWREFINGMEQYNALSGGDHNG